MDDIPSLSQFVTVLALVAGNGYFVAAEFAIVRSRPTKLKEAEGSISFGTASSLKLIEELDQSLSATQLGITVMSLLLGWKGEHIMSIVFERFFEWLPPSLSLVATHSMATAAALIIITVLHVVIGELAAKSIAIRYPEMTLRVLAPSMMVFSRVFAPALFIFTGAANLVLALFGIRAVTESERVHSSGELSMLIEHSTEYGILDKEEGEMLKGVFSFGDTVAREVMTPRTDVATVSSDISFPELLALIRNSRHSRFPVVGESVDDVLGILLARDVLSYMADGMPDDDTFDVRKLMRAPYFIPGTKPIDDLLNELKRRNQHLSIVLDEHGGMDGVVTLEDLIEEIVGEIFDESDLLEREIIEEGALQALLQGGVLVADVNQRFSLNIEEGDYDTLAGFIFSALGRMAVKGDTVTVKGSHPILVNGQESESYNRHHDEQDDEKDEDTKKLKAEFTVEKIVGNRIDQVRMRIIQEESPSPEDDNSSLPS
jgi:CBS domain containing-hemolysin-like protein